MKKSNIDIQAFYKEDSEILWCISWKDAYLYKLNLKKRVIDEVVSLLDARETPRAFGDILKYKNEFIFIPVCSDSVVILNRNNWKCEDIQLPDKDYRIGTTKFKFFTGVVYEDYLYLFGYSFPGIVRLDLVSKKTSIIDDWMNDKNLRYTNERDGCFRWKYCQIGESIYFPFENTNAVMEFHLPTEKIIIHEVGDCLQRYISVERMGNDLWLIPRDGKKGSIVKWNPFDNDIKYYRQYPESYNYEKYAFSRSVNVGNRIFLFANRSNMNISIDVLTGKMKKIPDIYDVSDEIGNKYPYVECTGGRVFFLKNGECGFWDYVSGNVENIIIEMGERVYSRNRKREIEKYFDNRKGKVVRERDGFDAEALIAYLRRQDEVMGLKDRRY